jgi:hypothetical protein
MTAFMMRKETRRCVQSTSSARIEIKDLYHMYEQAISKCGKSDIANNQGNDLSYAEPHPNETGSVRAILELANEIPSASMTVDLAQVSVLLLPLPLLVHLSKKLTNSRTRM